MNAHSEKSRDNQCNYPIIENYLSPENRDKALAHLDQCQACSLAIYRLENVFPVSRTSQARGSASATPADENKLAESAEKLSRFLENSADEKAAGGSTVLSTEELFRVMEIASAMKDFSANPAEKTPEYLKTIVRNRLEAQAVNRSPASAPSAIDRIAVRVKEGITLIGETMDNIFTLPTPEAVPVRSGAPNETPLENEKPSGYLHFFTKENGDRKMVYHFVQDSADTVMLTLKLQGYEKKPKSVNLKQNGTLLATCPVTKDYAYFARLQSGHYEMELKYNGDEAKQVSLDIISE